MEKSIGTVSNRRDSISTKDLLDSNNTTIASLQSTVYYIEVYGILLRPILTLRYQARKPEVTEGPASQYYVTKRDEYTKYLVNEISKHNIEVKRRMSM